MKILGALLMPAFMVGVCVAQINQTKQPLIDFLDPDSQTNIIVIRNGDISLPCPPQYTNLISNTNLFSLAEQKLLREIRLKYENVTTNSGPPGTVLASLKNTNGCWEALFQYTNSDTQDEVIFGVRFSARHLDKASDGYEVDIIPIGGNRKPHLTFSQLKHNVMNGLNVMLYDDSHCLSYMHYTNGMAIGKWLEWEADNGLSLEAEFKTPYDIQKNMIRLNIN